MTKKNNAIKTFRNVALTISTLLAAFFLLAFLPKIIADFSGEGNKPIPGREWEGQVMLAMFITYLLGYAIGWWKRLWGGIIILLSSLIIFIPFTVMDENYGALIFVIPQFVLGLLYILVHRFEKHNKLISNNSIG